MLLKIRSTLEYVAENMERFSNWSDEILQWLLPPAFCSSWARTTVSLDVQIRFSVQLAFAKFLSKIKGNF